MFGAPRPATRGHPAGSVPSWNGPAARSLHAGDGTRTSPLHVLLAAPSCSRRAGCSMRIDKRRGAMKTKVGLWARTLRFPLLLACLGRATGTPHAGKGVVCPTDAKQVPADHSQAMRRWSLHNACYISSSRWNRILIHRVCRDIPSCRAARVRFPAVTRRAWTMCSRSSAGLAGAT